MVVCASTRAPLGSLDINNVRWTTPVHAGRHTKRRSASPIVAQPLRKRLKAATPHHVLREKYALGKKIGRGRHGTVYSCTCKRTGAALAVKAISKAASPSSAQREKRVASMLSVDGTQHVNRVVEVLEDDQHVYVVQKLAAGGDLWQVARARACSEPEAKVLMTCVLRAIRSCHSLGIVHFDIKLENFVLARAGALDTSLTTASSAWAR